MIDRVFTVTAPAQLPVRFADLCVACERTAPGHAARLVTRDARYQLALWAGWHTLRVPACRRCALRLHLRRWWTFARTLLVGVAGMAFGLLVLLPRLSGLATGLSVLALIALSFLALFFVDRRFPPAFNMDLRGALIDYEFRSASCAERFAALNGAVPRID